MYGGGLDFQSRSSAQERGFAAAARHRLQLTTATIRWKLAAAVID